MRDFPQATTNASLLASDAYLAGSREEAAGLFGKYLGGLTAHEKRMMADTFEVYFLAQIPRDAGSLNRCLADDFIKSASAETVKIISDHVYPLGKAQANAVSLAQVAEIKGKETHPAVKSYLAGVSALSEADYQSAGAHYQVLARCAVYLDAIDMVPQQQMLPRPYRFRR